MCGNRNQCNKNNTLMKNYISLIFVLFMMKSFGIAQTPGKDRLRHELAIATHDTSRVLLLARLCGGYKLVRPDSALFYGSRALALARKINFPNGEVATMRRLSVTHRNLGNDSKELQIILQALKIAEKHNFIDHTAIAKNNSKSKRSENLIYPIRNY